MIQARHSSRCGGCEIAIEEGDMIGKVDGEWCCELCVVSAGGDDFERAQASAPISGQWEPA